MSESWKRFFQVQAVLAACCILCFVLLAIRIKFTGSMTYTFMVWNLFLGCIPVMFAIILRYFNSNNNGFGPRFFRVLVFGSWLLFFPNSIYMVSDLLHLSHIRSAIIPNWYDAVMLFSFAMTGLFLGLVSLRYIHVYLRSKYSSSWSWAIVGGSVVLSSFGVYLGRFLRWNSWDVIQDPVGLLTDVAQRIAHPISYFETYFVTGVFTMIMFLAYLLTSLINLQNSVR